MSIIIKTYLQCDNCGKTVESPVPINSRGEKWMVLTSIKWVMRLKQDLCNNCSFTFKKI